MTTPPFNPRSYFEDQEEENQRVGGGFDPSSYFRSSSLEEPRKGALRGFADVITAPVRLGRNLYKMASEYEGSGYDFLASIGGTLTGAAVGAAEMITQPAELAKGLWASTFGAVGDVADLTADWILDQFDPDRESVERAWWQGPDSKNLTDEERYIAARNVGVNAIGFGIGAGIATQIRKSMLHGAADLAGLPKNATLDDIVRWGSDKAPEANIGIAQAITQNGNKSFVKRVLKEGGGGGMGAALFDPAVAESDNPLRDAFLYGITGTLLAAPLELFSGHKKAVGQAEMAVMENVGRNNVRIMSAEENFNFAQDLVNELDPVESLIQHMHPYGRVLGNVDEGIDMKGLEARHRNNMAVYTDPKTGKQTFMVVGGKVMENAELQKRLKGSTVVDENGKPKKVFHGTAIDESFDVLATDKGGEASAFGSGAYFSEDPRITRLHSIRGMTDEGISNSKMPPPKSAGPRTYPAYLDLKNPLDINADYTPAQLRKFGVEALDRWADRLENKAAVSEDGIMLDGVNTMDGHRIYSVLKSVMDDDGVKAVLQNNGFDGIKYNYHGKPAYVVWSKDQIIPQFTTFESPLSKTAINQFQKYGYHTGLEVQYAGKSYVVRTNIKNDKVILVDPSTGEKVIAPRKDIVRLEAPKTYNIDGEILNPSGEPLITTSSLDDMLNELPREIHEQVADIKESIKFRRGFEAETISSTLTQNGFYISPQADGTMLIKSFMDPKFSKLVTPTEIRAASLDLTSPISIPELITKAQEGLISPPPNNPTLYNPQGIQRGKAFEIWHKFTSGPIMNRLTPLISYVEDIDYKYNTNLAPTVRKLKEAITAEVAAKQPHADRLRTIIHKLSKIPEVERVHARQYLETMDYKEWSQRGVYGFKPTPEERAFVERLTLTETDNSVATPIAGTADFLDSAGNIIDKDAARRLIDATKKSFSTTEERVKVNQFATEVRWLTENENISDKLRLEGIQKAMEKYGIGDDPRLGEIHKVIQEIVASNSSSLYNILRGAEILQDKHLSRHDYAKANKLSPEMTSTMREYDVAMRLVAEAIGLDAKYLVSGYFPHYARYNPKGVHIDIVSKDKTIPDDVRPFASSLTRTGYFGDDILIQDLGELTSRYLSGAFKNVYRDPLLFQLKREAGEALNSLPGDGNRKMAKSFERLYDNLETAAKSMDDPTDALALSSFDKLAARVTGSESAGPDFIRAWMKYIEFKAQGYKPIAGVRDGTSYFQFYAMNFGPRRTLNMIKLFKQAVDRMDDYAEAGMIPTLEPTQIGEATPSVSMTGKIARGFDAAVDEGFKWSLQPQMYKLAHTLSYMETTQNTARAITEFTSGKINRKRFAEMIDLEMYDNSVIRDFEAAMEKSDYRNATDVLARNTAHHTLGEYSRMTAPLVYQTKAGKFLGQFGQWPMWAINSAGKTLTRGSKKARATRAAYMALTFAAANYVAEETGLDFKSWLLNPLQFIPSGSPAYTILQDFGKSMETSGYMKAATWNSAIHGAQFVANPIPIGFMNMIEAIQRYDEGQPTEVVLFRLFGGRINNELFKRPKLFDTPDFIKEPYFGLPGSLIPD